MARLTGYQTMIREGMARIGRIGEAAPNQVEAWMRLEHGTLDGLSRADFAREIAAALDCIAASTHAENADLAMSFGL
jgi:hypothetical protein